MRARAPGIRSKRGCCVAFYAVWGTRPSSFTCAYYPSAQATLERRIFPGAYAPSLGEMMQIFEPASLSVLDVENLRLHYARTLRHWLDRYEAKIAEVSTMFDQSFVRMRRFYLAGSIAAFDTGTLQLFQVLVTTHDNNDIPPARDYMYPK
jgi:cyclopropane-fatty-acyl-phospholipid synthase